MTDSQRALATSKLVNNWLSKYGDAELRQNPFLKHGLLQKIAEELLGHDVDVCR